MLDKKALSCLRDERGHHWNQSTGHIRVHHIGYNFTTYCILYIHVFPKHYLNTAVIGRANNITEVILVLHAF